LKWHLTKGNFQKKQSTCFNHRCQWWHQPPRIGITVVTKQQSWKVSARANSSLLLVKTNTNIIDHVQLYFLNNQPLWYHGIAVAIFFWHATAWHILLWCFSLLCAIFTVLHIVQPCFSLCHGIVQHCILCHSIFLQSFTSSTAFSSGVALDFA